jgi:hypothetical protein
MIKYKGVKYGEKIGIGPRKRGDKIRGERNKRQESCSVSVEIEKNLKEVFETLNSLFAFNLMTTCVILL